MPGSAATENVGSWTSLAFNMRENTVSPWLHRQTYLKVMVICSPVFVSVTTGGSLG